ncbi:MAG: hypothetical protein KDD89_08835 [Anaerolineales bacterium]|nr:hypothetical protein [Anaerolineales bacterium]
MKRNFLLTLSLLLFSALLFTNCAPAEGERGATAEPPPTQTEETETDNTAVLPFAPDSAPPPG